MIHDFLIFFFFDFIHRPKPMEAYAGVKNERYRLWVVSHVMGQSAVRLNPPLLSHEHSQLLLNLEQEPLVTLCSNVEQP